jgi:hypothetical protein
MAAVVVVKNKKRICKERIWAEDDGSLMALTTKLFMAVIYRFL